MAHCFAESSYSTPASIAALVGDHDTDVGTDTPFSAIYKIASIIRHESYNPNSVTNNFDIALLKTVDHIRFNRGNYLNKLCECFTNEFFQPLVPLVFLTSTAPAILQWTTKLLMLLAGDQRLLEDQFPTF